MKCKLRCVNFRGVSDPTRAFQPAFGGTGICDDSYRSTMGVIVMSLRTPRSARENIACTWQHQGAATTSLTVPTTSLRVPTTSLRAATTTLGVPTASLGTPLITVWLSGNNNILFGNIAGVPGNHSYYISFNDFQNSCLQFVFSSIYL